MKRLLVAISFLITVISVPPAQAATSIYLVDKPHQLIDGSFIDDELATALLPSGKFGRYVYSPPRSSITWYVDAALLESISDMSDGYQLPNGQDGSGVLAAKSWLTRFALTTSGDRILTVPYGNPDPKIAQRLAPSELNFYYEFGKAKVELLIPGHKVETASASESQGQSTLSAPLRKAYTKNRQAITRLSTVINNEAVKELRASLAISMNPLLTKSEQLEITENATSVVEKFTNKLRVTNGKYQLTSKKVKVPVTLKNDFDEPVKVYLHLAPSNTRVTVGTQFEVTIPAKSRTQFSVPFNVIAPGSTVVTAEITNEKGQVVGSPALLQLNLSIFDSRVAWFTSGAGILLLIAAMTQTIRRVRRSRK